MSLAPPPADALPADAVATYLDLALRGDQRGAVRSAIELLPDGLPASVVITELLAPAQHEVGERWHRGELSSTEEHLVTNVSQASLEAIAAASSRPEGEGLVLVACAEGDWHALAAHMFAELLREEGWQVLRLGPSSPAEDVAALIERRRPQAVTVTCNLAMSYLGTSRLVDAAHAHGVPVLAGGRALDPHRATHLGADGWARDSSSAARVLDEWRTGGPSVDPRPVVLEGGALELDAQADEIGGRAFAQFEARLPTLAVHDRRRRARTREDLVHTVRFLAAARLVDDPEVFASFRHWLRGLYVARGISEHVLDAGARQLRPLVAEVDPSAAELLAAA